MSITLEQLAAILDIAPDGTIRFLVNGHQRFSINEKGISVSDRDPDPSTYGYHNAYFDGRVGIQVPPGSAPPSTKDLSPTGSFPEGAALSVQCTNIPDQVALNIWTGDRIADDGTDTIGVFVSTSDSHRANSRNVGLRIDSVNFPVGQVKAIDAREFGTPPMPTPQPYQGDAWSVNYLFQVRALYTKAHQVLDDNGIAVWFGRAVYDIGANTDSRPQGDYQFYLDKHLNNLASALNVPR